MGRPVDQKLRRTWRERLSRQAASGSTVAEFCREEGVSAPNFYSWRKRLGREAGAKRRARRSRPRGSGTRAAVQTKEPAVRFVQLPLATLPPSAVVELTLTDGTLIRVPGHADEALERILGMLLARTGSAVQEVPHD